MSTETKRPALGEGSTPGPWQTDGGVYSDVIEIWSAERGQLRSVLASVHIDEEQDRSGPEADARLIAQAWRIPKMIELLKDAEDRLLTLEDAEEDTENDRAVRADIVALLADIEGEEI